MFTLYLITNKATNKYYVGFTSRSVELRYRLHWRTARSGGGWLIHDAMRKYGPENFIIEIMEKVATREEAAISEMRFIKTINSRAPTGYNLTDGGDGARGHKHTAEWKLEVGRRSKKRGVPASTIEAARLHNTGRKKSEEFGAAVRLRMTGTIHSEKTIQKMIGSAVKRWADNPKITSEEENARLRSLRKGRTNTPEHNAAIRAANIGVVRSPETREKSRIAALARHTRERAAKAVTLQCDTIDVTALGVV